MIQRVHIAAAVTALLTLSTFWIATVGAELFGTVATIAWVKQSIAMGLVLLLPAMMATAGTGERMSNGAKGGILGKKRTRTRIAAANGLFVLVPCAISLWWLSRDGVLEPLFYGIQALEIVAGAVNVTLLSLNARDGNTIGSAKRAKALRKRASTT